MGIQVDMSCLVLYYVSVLVKPEVEIRGQGASVAVIAKCADSVYCYESAFKRELQTTLP